MSHEGMLQFFDFELRPYRSNGTIDRDALRGRRSRPERRPRPGQAEAARGIWPRIKFRNPRENILAKNPRASLVLTKGPSHVIEEVELRKFWAMIQNVVAFMEKLMVI